ncbi:hypothetical protein U3A58_04950 [Algoriphagus sp. C2-6-M1]|uniref:hypothetical protein n=1 Tax=Algoriphagus persicinus TaxID=3108754 RepID=UPI002B3BC580|nr:hypothetical protein [Algoriphagus sp. C2-6-M1]MEB2779733.1 hypothetical protein [Algoriphagus sp. C2-6-M1]
MNKLNISASMESFYLRIKRNRWYWIYSILCRFLLAYDFIVAGMVKNTWRMIRQRIIYPPSYGSLFRGIASHRLYFTFINTENEITGFEFCECIHRNGNPLDDS